MMWHDFQDTCREAETVYNGAVVVELHLEEPGADIGVAAWLMRH